MSSRRRCWPEGDGFRQALYQAGDGDPVHHLRELATSLAFAQQRDCARERHGHGLDALERRGVAAAHLGERTVLRAGLAARDGRIMKCRPSACAALESSRATSAEAVVRSTSTAPFFMPAKAPSSPSTAERRSSSLPTQQNTMSAPAAASRGVAAWRPGGPN